MRVRWMVGRQNRYYCPKWGKHHWRQSSKIERCIAPFDNVFTIENACECGAVKRIYSKNRETLQKFTSPKP